MNDKKYALVEQFGGFGWKVIEKTIESSDNDKVSTKKVIYQSSCHEQCSGVLKLARGGVEPQFFTVPKEDYTPKLLTFGDDNNREFNIIIENVNHLYEVCKSIFDKVVLHPHYESLVVKDNPTAKLFTENDINSQKHTELRIFMINENKKREIGNQSIRLKNQIGGCIQKLKGESASDEHYTFFQNWNGYYFKVFYISDIDTIETIEEFYLRA